MTRRRSLIAAVFAIGAVTGAALATPAAAVEKGELFLTQGLVCDRPSYVDAVVTLASSGEDLQGAMAQINAGAEKPRCITGTLLVARYVDKARTFFIKDQMVQVHKVKIVGLGQQTSSGIAPKKLAKPITRYVFSIGKATSI